MIPMLRAQSKVASIIRGGRATKGKKEEGLAASVGQKQGRGKKSRRRETGTRTALAGWADRDTRSSI